MSASLTDRLRAAVTIDEPALGLITPARMEADSVLWPGRGTVEGLKTTEDGALRLEEYWFTPEGGAPRIPLAVMFEDLGAGRAAARIYSSRDLSIGRHRVLPIDPDLAASVGAGDFMAGYFEALQAGDLEATLATFEPDGYIQHSLGERFSDPDQRRSDYIAIFQANGGKVHIRYCTVIGGGDIRILECVMQTGRSGCAVYERGATGRIGAVRVYL